ncbi:adenylyl-sulfate kinase [candidate division KSB1 bacterium]|nr:adenylyl-sulfate kinase [candidate division KSB1 bacterium]RQW11494.1 MAG: adenylyl-sulfate kinase [candidate division KSB1 bacterium]
MTEQKATNISWHAGEIGKAEREQFLGQKGIVIWYTGLSGSGKSTLAHGVEEKLFEKGHLCYVLDGDNIRHGLNKNLGFSPQDRTENIRRIGEVARLFADAGLITMTAFISPYRADRQIARELLKDGEFIEIYVKVPLEVAEQRDTKGLYKKARAGEIKEFTGISAPYEEPLNPEMVIDTAELSLQESVAKVISHLVNAGIISTD